MSASPTAGQAGLSYRDAGVDIEAGDALVDRIKPFAKRTMREGVLGGIGGFGVRAGGGVGRAGVGPGVGSLGGLRAGTCRSDEQGQTGEKTAIAHATS